MPGCDPVVESGLEAFVCPMAATFDAARTVCTGSGFDLLTIADNETYRAALAHLPQQTHWIGLRRSAVQPSPFAWSDGTAYAFDLWNPGEPNLGGAEACGAYRPWAEPDEAPPGGLGIADFPCETPLPFICGPPPLSVGTTGSHQPPTLVDEDCDAVYAANGRTYLRCTNDDSFDEARDRCIDMGMRLAEPRSAVEDAFLVDSTFAGLADAFIGLTDTATEGDFRWADGSPLAFTPPWANGEPDVDSQKNCVAMEITSNTWRTRDCDDQRPFICETPWVPGP